MTKKPRAKGVTQPAKRGGQSAFSAEAAAEIIKRLSDGEPLTIICSDDWLPCDNTVRAWAAKDKAFAGDIACARARGHDAIAWRARLTLRGKTSENGGESTGDVQRDKAIADYDLKLLAKWDPKGYGEKLAHVGGGPDDSPIQTAIDLSNLTADQLRALASIKLPADA